MLKESYWTKALEKEYSSFRKRHVHLFFIFCKTLEKEQILSFLISSFKALVMEEAERKLLNESLRKRGFFLSKAAGTPLFCFSQGTWKRANELPEWFPLTLVASRTLIEILLHFPLSHCDKQSWAIPWFCQEKKFLCLFKVSQGDKHASCAYSTIQEEALSL